MATLRLRNGSTVSVPDEHADAYVKQGLTRLGGEAPVAQKRRRTSSAKPKAVKGKDAVTPPPAPTSPATVPPVTPPAV